MSVSRKNIFKPALIALCAVFASSLFASEAQAKSVAVEKRVALGGVIKGIVRDESGSPIADATVAIFRVGTSKLLKQVISAADGSFLAKILPGTYTVLAVAEGFNPVTVATVEVNRSAELVYGFKLERAGGGNTLPEKRADRNSSKWRIRAAQAARSIYQNREGEAPAAETAQNTVEQNVGISGDERGEGETKRAGQTVVETYFASSDRAGNYTGVNVARLQPISDNAEIVFAGQTGTSRFAPQRFEANVKYRPNGAHQIRLNTSAAKLGAVKKGSAKSALGQVSFSALDEWKVRGGVILVFGLDYSRFVGAGDDSSIAPRLGVQYDINSKTRFRSAYTTQTEAAQGWQQAIELEDAQVLFREPIAVEDLVVEQGKPQMNRSSRMEFGVERILDNKSSIEANVFFDMTAARGVGLSQIPFTPLGSENFVGFVADQQGSARGVRVVYSRRINGMFSTAAGYAFGNGQKLSQKAISNPANAFENAAFQTFVGQFNADLAKTGTQVKTIFRLSPQATVFAIDPFAGRMAIYDPSLSVLVTQSLPNWGLPIHAEAIVDARNLFDFQSSANSEEGSLRLNSQGRILRGGIMVRF